MRRARSLNVVMIPVFRFVAARATQRHQVLHRQLAPFEAFIIYPLDCDWNETRRVVLWTCLFMEYLRPPTALVDCSLLQQDQQVGRLYGRQLIAHKHPRLALQQIPQKHIFHQLPNHSGVQLAENVIDQIYVRLPVHCPRKGKPRLKCSGQSCPTLPDQRQVTLGQQTNLGIQPTGLHHLLIAIGIVSLPKQNVATEASVEDPWAGWGICHPPPHCRAATDALQLATNRL
mmetsp:Transcript_22352/g.39878  ORF Transcript_22352/g.39878 Transcript_22352/m.39878 type:complete len:230 (+) Transcript_22352:2564-3253(+)